MFLKNQCNEYSVDKRLCLGHFYNSQLKIHKQSFVPDLQGIAQFATNRLYAFLVHYYRKNISVDFTMLSDSVFVNTWLVQSRSIFLIVHFTVRCQWGQLEILEVCLTFQRHEWMYKSKFESLIAREFKNKMLFKEFNYW